MIVYLWVFNIKLNKISKLILIFDIDFRDKFDDQNFIQIQINTSKVDFFIVFETIFGKDFDIGKDLLADLK